MTSKQQTGQQWDAPNAWPPLQHMMIEGLAQTGCPSGLDLAKQLAGVLLNAIMPHGKYSKALQRGRLQQWMLGIRGLFSL